ncbi:DUF3784 domain-containing protein [Bacillus sp. 31A1R]|uniref:DUF3784 domain-containing protein n=1 Tax=Robertmurraya mangrovi TaxID=3098077 RepID=A0ABU5J3W4_9BACI|nr:DUF3784 domain-containing protein [Bacillus sp. 31A1R]MDZ5474104.1 DUF3784 domain-containing protein [Bacillus sp. 31A1R]
MLLAINIFISVLFIALAYLIEKKKIYDLLSNFNNRSKEEQQELIQNGYPQRVGKMLKYIGIVLLLLTILNIAKVPFSIEIYFSFLMLSLFGGMIYLSKFEVKGKRKRSYWITSIIAVVSITSIVILFLIGYKEHDVIIKAETFEITGMYGDKWRLEEIKEVTLLNEYPQIKTKLSGFGTEQLAKGSFRLEELGRGKLFIYKNQKPYILIKLNKQYVILNSKNPVKTELWYEQLKGNSE